MHLRFRGGVRILMLPSAAEPLFFVPVRYFLLWLTAVISITHIIFRFDSLCNGILHFFILALLGREKAISRLIFWIIAPSLKFASCSTRLPGRMPIFCSIHFSSRSFSLHSLACLDVCSLKPTHTRRVISLFKLPNLIHIQAPTLQIELLLPQPAIEG